MQQHFIIRKDLPSPYFQHINKGIKQMTPFHLRDGELEQEISAYIDIINSWKGKLEGREMDEAIKKFPQIKNIQRKIFVKLNQN